MTGCAKAARAPTINDPATNAASTAPEATFNHCDMAPSFVKRENQPPDQCLRRASAAVYTESSAAESNVPVLA
jgi:hypothetical protein